MDGERGLPEVAELVNGGAFVVKVFDHLFGDGGGVCGDIFLADPVFSCEDEGMDCVKFRGCLFLPNGEMSCDVFESSERSFGFCEGLFVVVCSFEGAACGGG